jgi:hypothetical protein
VNGLSKWRERRRARDIERVKAAQAVVASMSPWARRGVYVFGGVLFAAGLGMSGFFLSQLAESFGIAAPWSYLLPAALDAGAIVGVFMWVTGTGEIELFGRILARQLFALSILGNGLERALTFAPAGGAVPGAELSLAGLLERTVQLMTLLTSWEDPRRGAATWFLLLVSVGIGIVFPVLAYRMGHAIILARKSADAPSRGRKGPQHSPAPVKAGLVDRVRQAVAAPAQAAQPPAAAELPAAPAVQPVPAAAKTPAPAAAAPVTPLPYVHDSRDLEPGTPEWQDRYNRLPGTGKQTKLEHWLEREWQDGREPKLTPTADRVVGGSRVGQLAKKALRERAVLPPSERTETRQDETGLAKAS